MTKLKILVIYFCFLFVLFSCNHSNDDTTEYTSSYAVTATQETSNTETDDSVAEDVPEPADYVSLLVDLNPEQVISGGDYTGSANAEITLNQTDGSIAGDVYLQNIVATAVTLNAGYAGEEGTVLLHLEAVDDNHWRLPANAIISNSEVTQFQSGQIFLQILTSSYPKGALRGQILSDEYQLFITTLSAAQVIPLHTTTIQATAKGYLTFNTLNNLASFHIQTFNLEDAMMAHIHQAPAGDNGPLLFHFTQDADSASHWVYDTSLTNEELDALLKGEFYYLVYSDTWPEGVLRGQIVPAGYTIDFVSLTTDDVPGSSINSDLLASAAATLDYRSQMLLVHINLENVGNNQLLSASMKQGLVGENGPTIMDFDQQEDETHWYMQMLLTDLQYESLQNQEYYFMVATTDWPDGIVRGQYQPSWTTDTDTSLETFQVMSTQPESGIQLDQFPEQIIVQFNDQVRASSITQETVLLYSSGGDGEFQAGNEQQLALSQFDVNSSNIVIDLTGLQVTDDIFQLVLKGTGENYITDNYGNIIDGNEDGNAGGDYKSNFEVISIPEEPKVTFSDIQENIFAPKCVACHQESFQSGGLDLSAENAYTNIVNRASLEVPNILLVSPDAPEASYLFEKISEATPQVGDRMPLGAPNLTNEEIQKIYDWISQGALNN